MALSNLISVVFTAEELESIQTHLTAVETILKAKCLSLTPDDRSAHARLGHRTENWSKKTIGHMRNFPSFTPTHLNVQESERDYKAREDLKPIITKISGLQDLVDDTMLLLGTDIYHSSLAFYQHIRYLAEQNVAGAKAIYEELSLQFPGRPTSLVKK